MHKRFPSIEQYKNVIRHVKYTSSFRGFDENGNAVHDITSPLPILRFEGTVKLHGTNAGIVLYPDGRYQTQSRERNLSLVSDNHGFTFYVHSTGIHNQLRMDLINNDVNLSNPITVYGEWCGEGIQSGVGIANIAKMFVIFAIREDVSDDKVNWYSPDNFIFSVDELKKHKCYLINHFKTFTLDIDFNHPELAQNTLVDLTMRVEEQCPVASAFNVEGIGEGIVWKCVQEGYTGPEYWFKVKGEKHSTSKVKKLASVDVEKVNSIIEFSERVVTENRLKQGIEYLKEMNKEITIKTTGDFIRWIYNDVLKEESDIVVASGIDVKDLGKFVAEPAKRWYFKYLESESV